MTTMATTEPKATFLKGVYLYYESNNGAHHTDDITIKQLIVRRGQPFLLTFQLGEAFDPYANPLTITAQTGEFPQEDLGTKSSFSIPAALGESPSSKVAWSGDLYRHSSIRRGILTVFIHPPPNCPIGKYKLLIKYKEVETNLADLVVLFNPWVPDDPVFQPFEKKKKEYVLNEQGVIYRGTTNYILPMDWDFGQFEEDMVDICMAMLDKSLSYQEDPARDVASRGDPTHVSRVLSAMVNSEDDNGILVGNWGDSFYGGYAPTHWSGSHEILKQWYLGGQPVKYGQCWVFAGVLCSVMRLLGIPCRVISNFSSAHDGDRNLTIDRYHSLKGIEERQSPDSVWNFHVWVEGWFTRPDLSKDGEYDGWQVLDATPQETSGGVYRCGPVPVKAVKKGATDVTYDTPFVYAEVNADCIDWLVVGEGEKDILRMVTDTKKVGQNISTKAVGSKFRRDVTNMYKFKEGTPEERKSFWYAVTRDYSRVLEWDDLDEEDSDDELDFTQPFSAPEMASLPQMTMRFEEETQPINGNDVRLNLVLQSKSSAPKELTINISVQAMRYNGVPAANIQSEENVKTLNPNQELSFPIVVPYATYHKHMVTSESMKINAMVSEIGVPENTYLAEHDVVLLDPEILLSIPDEVRVSRRAKVEVVFENPVEERLTNCTLTVSGSGLFKDNFECILPDLRPGNRVRINVFFVPYKRGQRTLLVDFDSSEFRDIKASIEVNVL
ncbi:unnamed protein product [Ophioblennius macclurei]